jgi:hypothetical protein
VNGLRWRGVGFFAAMTQASYLNRCRKPSKRIEGILDQAHLHGVEMRVALFVIRG